MNKRKVLTNSTFISGFILVFLSLFVYSYLKNMYETVSMQRELYMQFYSHMNADSVRLRDSISVEAFANYVDSASARHTFSRKAFYYHMENYVAINRAGYLKGSLNEFYNNKRITYILLPFFLLIPLLIIRGWLSLKPKVKEIHPLKHVSIFAKIQALIGDNTKGIRWFLGRVTLSYGFLKKRIVLGQDYYHPKNDEKTRKFILFHEIAHVKSADSFIKNFLINTRKIFLPVLVLSYFVIVWTTGFYGSYFKESCELYTEETLGTFLLVMFVYYWLYFSQIGLLYVALKRLEKWFAHSKEFLADKFASISIGGFIPNLEDAKDKHHPSGRVRREAITNGKKYLSIFPILLIGLAVMNINSHFATVNLQISDVAFFLLLSTFLFVDIIYFQFCTYKLKDFFKALVCSLALMVLIIFNYQAHELNQSWNLPEFTLRLGLMLLMNVLFVGLMILSGILYTILNLRPSSKKHIPTIVTHE